MKTQKFTSILILILCVAAMACTASAAGKAVSCPDDASLADKPGETWQSILSESKNVREIPFRFQVDARGSQTTFSAEGCQISLFFMDKDTGKPICQIGTYVTGPDGCARTILKLPMEYVMDSNGRDSLSPSWFGMRLQDRMEIGSETYIGKFAACDYASLTLNDFFPGHDNAGVRKIIYEESYYNEQILSFIKK